MERAHPETIKVVVQAGREIHPVHALPEDDLLLQPAALEQPLDAHSLSDRRRGDADIGGSLG